MSARTITATVPVWIGSHSSIGPQQLCNGSAEELIDGLTFVTLDMTACGYTMAGTAEITVTLVDTDTLIANKVETLRQELSQHRAEAHVKENAILEQINNLLAITYKPDPEPEAA
jgi:hypothetical protein